MSGPFPQPTMSSRGTVELAAATTDAPYHGKYRNMTAMVVGFGTEHERVFTVAQRGAARAYAKKHQVGMSRVIANQLPENVAVDLFGE